MLSSSTARKYLLDSLARLCDYRGVMQDERHDEGVAEKRGQVGANLAALLAMQDLKPVAEPAGSKAEGRCDCPLGEVL